MGQHLNELELIDCARRHRDEAGMAEASGDTGRARELARLAAHAEAMAARALERYFQPAI